MSDVVKINVNMIVAISEELLFKLVEFAENLGRKKNELTSSKNLNLYLKINPISDMEREMLLNG